MGVDRIVRAWKDPDFRRSLSPEELSALPENPAGLPLAELDAAELQGVVGGNTANSYCNCYSDGGSCGRVCTATTECPVMTWICC
ncbi:MAG: mersacidin/lichenicidin family type 2 lantibiotic [Clostridiales bacterium]|nr:mersacidin/lichenicidin family type 2 lantibiotic [Clostridiales bacterium]